MLTLPNSKQISKIPCLFSFLPSFLGQKKELYMHHRRILPSSKFYCKYIIHSFYMTIHLQLILQLANIESYKPLKCMSAKKAGCGVDIRVNVDHSVLNHLATFLHLLPPMYNTCMMPVFIQNHIAFRYKCCYQLLIYYFSPHALTKESTYFHLLFKGLLSRDVDPIGTAITSSH